MLWLPCLLVAVDRTTAIVLPVLDDWECLGHLLPELGSRLERPDRATIVIVDDGSLQRNLLADDLLASLPFAQIVILQLATNLGHQRAISIGLAWVDEADTFDDVLILDSDGEDDPKHAPDLLRAAWEHPESIIVAQRGNRSEGMKFAAFYRLYKGMFTALTGQRLDFGNFVVVPGALVSRLLHMPELWNNVPATIMRSRIPIIRIRRDRGTRYFDQSRMNFTALVNHGLGAISVFMDRVFVRLLVAFGIALLVLAGFALAALVVRVGSDVALPGWLALGGVVAALGLIQILAVLIVATFIVTATRSNVAIPLARRAPEYIEQILTLSTSNGAFVVQKSE